MYLTLTILTPFPNTFSKSLKRETLPRLIYPGSKTRCTWDLSKTPALWNLASTGSTRIGLTALTLLSDTNLQKLSQVNLNFLNTFTRDKFNRLKQKGGFESPLHTGLCFWTFLQRLRVNMWRFVCRHVKSMALTWKDPLPPVRGRNSFNSRWNVISLNGKSGNCRSVKALPGLY